MARAVVYCDRCGNLVAPGDVDAGNALVGDAGAICSGCLNALSPDERDATEARLFGAGGAPAEAVRAALPRRAARSSAGSQRSRTQAARSPTKAGGLGSQGKVFIAASAGGLVLGVVVVVLLRSGGGEGPGRAPRRAPASTPVATPPERVARQDAATPPGPAPHAAAPTRPPVVAEAAPAPPEPPAAEPASSVNDRIQSDIAKWKLSQAKSHHKANPNDIVTFREKLEQIRRSFTGTKAAEEAARLLEEVKLPELPPECDPKPPGDEAWAKAVRVLPAVDPGADRLKGNWRMDGGRLRSDKGMWAKIGLPYLLPDEYDVRVTFERVENADCLLVILARGGRPFIFSIGGNSNTGCSLEDIKESGPDVYPTKITRAGVLPRDGRHTAVILVRKKCLRAYVDGRPMVGCQVDDDGLSLPSDLRAARPGQLGLATWNTVFVFHSLEVLAVRGEGRLLR
ncbi:MAG: hypothetical protein ACYSU0_00430 [Planctomycetota bacterium]